MYNYKHFKSKEYDFSKFEGPKPGENAIDFEVVRLGGDKVKLSDFFGDWIVLETGSITCPIYESKIEPMNQLAEKFPDIRFLVLYVREAHPGENIPQHSSFEGKMLCAKRANETDRERRIILVDDLGGTAHQMYGGMPNSVYVINPERKIVFRGDWNDVAVVEKILSRRHTITVLNKERFSARPNFSGGVSKVYKVLSRAGKQAVRDFAVAFPTMLFKHFRKLFY